MSLRHRSSTTYPDDAPVQEAPPLRGVMETPESFARTDAAPPAAPVAPGARGASAGLIIGGFLALLLAAWAGIAPFVGPTFGFSADGTSSWTWNEMHAFGAAVPGAVGVLAGLLVLTSARRPMGHQSAGALGLGGFALFLCGAWLTVVPVAWPVLVGTYFHAASSSLTLAHWMGLASGPGVLLAAFGGIVMGCAGRESATKHLMA